MNKDEMRMFRERREKFLRESSCVVDEPYERVAEVEIPLTGVDGVTLASGEKRVLAFRTLSGKALRIVRFSVDSISRPATDVMVTSVRAQNRECVVDAGVGIPLVEIHRNTSMAFGTAENGQGSLTLHNMGEESILVRMHLEGIGVL